MKTIFKSNTTVFLASILITFSVILSLSFVYTLFFEKPIIAVDLTTMTQEDVLLWANEHEVTIQTVEVYDETSSAGTIMTQDVTKDSPVPDTKSITITVSKGPDPDVLVLVEDFKGQDIAAIQTFIDTSKLMNASIKFEKSTKVKTSILISQSVTNQEIKRSDEVVFVISTGSRETLDKITVPNFSTLSKSEITKWGTANNIKINFIEEFNATAEYGKVFEQSVAADATVYDGSAITIKISRGAGVVLENLVGKTKADIDRYASINRLKVTYTYAYSATKAKDVALSTTSKANTRIEENSTISYVISLGKVSVSDYVNKTQTSFESWIASVNKDGANLKIKSSILFSDSIPKGSIITQSPSTGEVELGATITIHVSKGPGVIVKAFALKTDTQEGLKISFIEKYSAEAAGKVLTQSIAEGTRVDVDTPITLTVSLGKVPVVSKIGSTLSSLQSWVDSVNAKGAFLTISSSEAYSSSQDEKGKIISQTPSSDSVNPGTTITVVISKGIQVTVPTFAGTSTTAFTGLVVNRTEEYSSTVPNGVVISQSIAAGTKVDYGSSINLVVSKGEDPATQPAYLPPLAPMVANNAISFNDTKSRLSAYLSGLGFTNYSFVSGDYSIGSGQVNSQSLPAGSYAKDVEIIIYVQQ